MLNTDLADLRACMAQDPGAVIEDVARERKVSPRAVIEALPRKWCGSAAAMRLLLSCRMSRSGAR